ncbi:ARF-binding protein [Spiromyces aspiralis]|uniref:ARF-binding protein n=1 Tax=Spiromyces aspiralis TaxID=68401 RepID=A0ACC1HYI7_9FUNG|nr:ARF-binding protein [Spiromyces aspiralis]
MNLQQVLGEYFKPPNRLQAMIGTCHLLPLAGLLTDMNFLLDNLVKNCGHSVHYQIASRDFLNQLFRKFPEFQPATPNPIHYRILEMLQMWRNTLCKHSRYKEDLTRINDMYRLLLRKGWEFPEVEQDNAAILLGPQEALKTKEELEKEDLEAMKAKLQELLRRATPHDLREANKLMKIITGYEESNKRPDYDSEWKKELKNIEERAELLVEMARAHTVGKPLDETTEDILGRCLSYRTKIQRMISEREEDEEEDSDLEMLIQLNHKLVNAIQMCKDVQEGKVPTLRPEQDASEWKGEGSSDPSLINWDDENAHAKPESQEQTRPSDEGSSAPKSTVEDLLGLAFNDTLLQPAQRPLNTPGQTPIYLPPTALASPQLQTLAASSPPSTTGMVTSTRGNATSSSSGLGRPTTAAASANKGGNDENADQSNG